MKFFSVPLLKKKPEKVVIHVGTNDASHSAPYEMFIGMIQKIIPSAKRIILSPDLPVDKAHSDIDNKKLNYTHWDCVHHENIDESHLNKYGLHI